MTNTFGEAETFSAIITITKNSLHYNYNYDHNITAQSNYNGKGKGKTAGIRRSFFLVFLWKSRKSFPHSLLGGGRQ